MGKKLELEYRLSMNAIKKELMTLEHHCLETPYVQCRLPRKQYLQKLTQSIEQNGQLVPVILVPKTTQKWILMDGHLRVKALKNLGQDLIQSEIWDCDVSEALLMLLKEHASSPLEIIEEALLLQTLCAQQGLSQNDIALRLGRDKSWVSRRLSFINVLPEPVIQAVLLGKVSLWVATRVLAPLARANAYHVQQLLDYLLKESLSTREVQCFYEYYQRANLPERTKMLQDPGLFLKAQQFIEAEKAIHKLRAGPEGEWEKQCGFVLIALQRLIALNPNVFTTHFPLTECKRLLKIADKLKKQFTVFSEGLGGHRD
jgi:ParB family chromosome partitioning protein